MGSASAYWLSRSAGAEVLGIEQFALGHLRGGSQDHSRIIRRAYHTPEYTILAGHAYDVWAVMEREAEEKVVFLVGGINFGKPGSSVDKYIASLTVQNVPHEVLTPGEVARRWPQFKLSSDMVAAYAPDSGFVDAARANAAHVRMAKAHGAKILEKTLVESVRIHDGRVEVETPVGTFEGERLVLTSGAWTNQVLDGLGMQLPLTVTQEQVTYFRSPNLEDFSPGRFPIWIASDLNEKTFYGCPAYGEPAVKASQDAGGREVTAETRTFDADLAMLARLTKFLKMHIPGMLGPIHYTKTCLYTMPPDRNFILDRLPDHPNVVVCVCAGHMFKFASLVGKIMSQLAIRGSTEYPIGFFNLRRPAITDPDFPKSFQM